MTRIVHIFSTFDPGGPQVRAVGILAAMPDCEHVVVPMDGRSGAVALLAPGTNARVVLPPAEGRKTLTYGLRMRGFLRGLAPDLLVTYNWGAIDAVIASRLALRIPVVHCEDGFLPDEAVRRKLRRRVTRFALLNTVHATVVPSRTLERIARREYGLAASRVRYIANGIDLQRFSPRRDPSWRRAHGIPDDALLVGSLGGLRPEKDLGVLLRAFAQAGDGRTRLAVVGGGPDREMLERSASSLGIRHRVVFAGPEKDPSVCYRSFDLFAMSSATEQMPLALLEAMGSGLAAVVTGVGDCAALVGGDPAVIAPAKDPAALAARLARVLCDPAERARLGAANRLRAERDYDRERMLREWIGLFRTAIGSRRAFLRGRPEAGAGARGTLQPR